MEIIRTDHRTKKSKPSKPMSIRKFAEEYGLVMEIRKYDYGMCASFQYAEIKDNKGDRILVSACGRGKNERESVKNYSRQISGKLLVINAMKNNRREIQVPTLKG